MNGPGVRWGIVAMLAVCLLPTAVPAQLKSIEGNVGGQYETQKYDVPGTLSEFERYRQLVTLVLTGYAYNPNLAEFTVQTKFINTNSSVTSFGSSSKEHDTYFNYYDIRADLLRSTRFPVSLNARQDETTLDVSGGVGPSFSNKILTRGYGVRAAPSLNDGNLNLTVSYDATRTESLSPLFSMNQLLRNARIGMESSLSRRTNLGVELIQRDRKDDKYATTYRTREVLIRAFSQPDDSNNVALNANVFSEASLDFLNANVLWNSQMPGERNNQLGGQLRWSKTLAFNSFEGQLSDHLDIGFSPEWRGLFILSHSEGQLRGPGYSAPNRATSVVAGVTHLKEFERFQLTFASRASYNRFQSLTTSQTLEGQASGAIHMKGYSFGRISLSDQATVRRWITSASLTMFQNTIVTTLESNAIPLVFLHANGSYTYTRELVDAPPGFAERNLNYDVNATFRWRNTIEFLLTAYFGENWIRSASYARTLRSYGAQIQLPNILRDLTLQGRVGRRVETQSNWDELTYDIDLTFNWRALALAARWVGYSYAGIHRNDFYVTLSRPFRAAFE